MQRYTAVFLLTIITAVLSSAAAAQVDATDAFAQGKTACADGDFTAARDFFQKASQTDPANPEIFLWLGKAQYQLGQVDEAIAAWANTLKLAPQEPYADKMLKALRGQLVEADTTIRLIEVMLEEKLFSSAKGQCGELLKDKALTDTQRVGVMTLQAQALLGMGNHEATLKTVYKLLTVYPQLADKAETTLLLGQAKIRIRSRVAEALSLLNEVVTDHAGTLSAVTAQYEIAAFNLQHAPTGDHARELAAWVAANSQHARTDDALELVVKACLALAAKEGAATQLNLWDATAVNAAKDLYMRTVRAKEALELTHRIVRHLQKRYVKHKAHAAAIAGIQELLTAQLPPSSRAYALRTLGQFKEELALEQLTTDAKAGRLAAGEMPDVLADVLVAYGSVNSEFPGEQVWADQAALAERVRKLAPIAPKQPGNAQIKAPYAWAVEIALDVIRADAHADSVNRAVKIIRAIVNDTAKSRKEPDIASALEINSKLLDVLKPTNSAWVSSMFHQAELLDAAAIALFKENVRAGRGGQNDALSEPQQRLLATLTRLVTLEATQAAKALDKVRSHIQLWISHGHYKAAGQAYTQLAELLPTLLQRRANLDRAGLLRQQVFKEHNRIISAGLTVPRELDPALIEALSICYQLQQGLGRDDPFINEVRQVWYDIVGHYKRLEYFDVAQDAINVKAPTTNPAADEYAALQSANLKFELARRDLALLLKQYDGKERITLKPAFAGAIESYTNFISERPTSLLRGQAVDKVFQIAKVFENAKAYDVAVQVYNGFAAFSQTLPVLTQAAPGASSPAQRAAFASVAALDAKARSALAKQLAERKDSTAAPEQISAEFAAAIASYKNFAKTYPESVLLSQAIEKIMAVGLKYAQVDAWDVASAIYAGLITDVPEIRRPERIEFARGVCKLGKVMPDHAKEILSALTLKQVRGPMDGAEVSAVALSSPLSASGRIHGGYAGGGGIQSYNEPAATPMPSRTESDESSATGAQSFPGGIINADVADSESLINDSRVLAAIRRQEATRAGQIARLREELQFRPVQQKEARQRQAVVRRKPVLSDAELTRQQVTLDGAYEIFQAVRSKYPQTHTAEQCRGEIKVMIDHWRTLSQWQRAALLGERFLTDNPLDKDLPHMRLSIARDFLAWASQPVEDQPSKQVMLAEVGQRFGKVRTELANIATVFPNERKMLHQAQWDIANSFLSQARVVDAFSRTLARGQYVRASEELLTLANTYYDHPKIGSIPQMLWDISQELAGREYYNEAISVWNNIMIRYPTNSLAEQAAWRIAQTYQNNLKQPLRAAEAYQEVNVARGGNDMGVQNAIYGIGSELKNKKRWVEALHVLAMFVDSFPRHAQAGQALTMIGQVHQTNEAWKEAIAAYRRVIAEFPSGNWVKDAKWAIAECTINLSQWRQAMESYQSYKADYPGDNKTVEVERRIGILKDLVRYQALVDEQQQRKAFDAQHQIATIVLEKLSNRVKAIIEYKKVAANWPKSHLADDALYAVGTTYMAMEETLKARQALRTVAREYPDSPLADNALYMVGKSYEDEADRFAKATRAKTIQKAQEFAQRQAYARVQGNWELNRNEQLERIKSLRRRGKGKKAELEEAKVAGQNLMFNDANVDLAAEGARQAIEVLTAVQLADRQDKINAALRQAVRAYDDASKVPAGDKAGDALLRMATIYNERLKDSAAAMTAWLEIVRQFSGTAVAEDASWRIAQQYERQHKYADAIEAYKAFLRNYRRSAKAGAAQFAIAENYEHLNQWINAMDAYTNYINNFPNGPMVKKAREQITWIKAYRL